MDVTYSKVITFLSQSASSSVIPLIDSILSYDHAFTDFKIDTGKEDSTASIRVSATKFFVQVFILTLPNTFNAL